LLPQTEDVGALLSGKTALKYAGPEVDAMRAVSKAAQHRSLKEFEAALAAHPAGTAPLQFVAHRLERLDSRFCFLVFTIPSL